MSVSLPLANSLHFLSGHVELEKIPNASLNPWSLWNYCWFFFFFFRCFYFKGNNILVLWLIGKA